MSKVQEIRAYLEEHNPEALYIGNGEEHDSALIGIARIQREKQWVEVAIYSYEALVEHFKNEFLSDKEEPLSEDDAEVEAMEWVDYNVAGGYLGIYTPLIINS